MTPGQIILAAKVLKKVVRKIKQTRDGAEEYQPERFESVLSLTESLMGILELSKGEQPINSQSGTLSGILSLLDDSAPQHRLPKDVQVLNGLVLAIQEVNDRLKALENSVGVKK